MSWWVCHADHIARLVASIAFQITHGYAVESFDDPLVRVAETCTHEFSFLASPGAYLVDLIPACAYPAHRDRVC